MKYRKKPVIIDAKKWDGDAKAMMDFVNSIPSEHRAKRPTTIVCANTERGGIHLEVVTLEGTMKATLGDYIICGVEGEFYFCKPDIFEKTYEVVE